MAFVRGRCEQRQFMGAVFRGGRRVADDACGVHHRRQVDRGQSSPRERGLVHRDRRAVQFHRAHQRFERKRHQSLLPGVAEHEEIGGDGIAHQRGGELGRIHLEWRFAIQRGAYRRDDVGRRELHVRPRGERAGHRFVGIEHDGGAARAHFRQRPIVVHHHHVATQHQIGLTCRDAHGVDVVGRFGDADVRRDRAALLRQAGLVQHARALGFQMPGHAEQCANRDHAGAADAGDEDVPGLGQVGAERWHR